MNFDFNKGFASLQGTVSDLGSSITPFAKRTRQMLNEKLGGAEEVTALPVEYLELERRVDALRAFHTQLLAVTQTYENEGYDYPPNLREQLSDFGRNVQERVQGAASAQSANELGSILVGGARSKEKREPKTLAHALARALASAESPLADANLEPLSKASGALAKTETVIGAARLEQDEQITRANAGLNTTLTNSLSFSAKARKNVHNARLSLDAAKGTLRTSKTPEAQAEVDKAEDEFVAAIEDAVTVMKNVLDTPEPVRGLTQLAHAQLSFFKQAAQALEAIVPDLEGFQEQQETAYRESRQ